MKIKELIERLLKEDPDTLVTINGYEGGVDIVGNIDKGFIVKNVNTEWYYGKHEFLSNVCNKESCLEDVIKEPCIKLRR